MKAVRQEEAKLRGKGLVQERDLSFLLGYLYHLYHLFSTEPILSSDTVYLLYLCYFSNQRTETLVRFGNKADNRRPKELTWS